MFFKGYFGVSIPAITVLIVMLICIFYHNRVNLAVQPSLEPRPLQVFILFFFSFFFRSTDRTTITRDEAMGNETFYWDGLAGLNPRRKMTKLRNTYPEDIAFGLCFQSGNFRVNLFQLFYSTVGRLEEFIVETFRVKLEIVANVLNLKMLRQVLEEMVRRGQSSTIYLFSKLFSRESHN